MKAFVYQMIFVFTFELFENDVTYFKCVNYITNIINHVTHDGRVVLTFVL